MELLLTILLVLMIISALLAVEMKNLLSSIIAVGAVGAFISIAFLFLGAPDLAIIQIVFEVMILIMLIRATISRDATEVTEEEVAFISRIVSIVVLMLIFVFGLKIFADFPEFGKPVFESHLQAPSNLYLQHSLEKTGAANVVSAISLDFRAYDTLGAVTVLFVGILGAFAVLRSRARRKTNNIEILEEDETGE